MFTDEYGSANSSSSSELDRLDKIADIEVIIILVGALIGEVIIAAATFYVIGLALKNKTWSE